MLGLVEAVQPAHDWGVAQLVLDMICSVMFSGNIGRAAVLPYVAILVHALQLRLAGTTGSKDGHAKMRQQYVVLVQHMLAVPQYAALFSRPDPQVLAEMLTHLQFQFESSAKSADREAAGSAIELLAAAALEGLWKAQHWQVHKRLKDAAAAVTAAAKAAKEAAERRAKDAAWFAELGAARATFPEQQTLAALSVADLKKKLTEEVRVFSDSLFVRSHSRFTRSTQS
jgi:hypothetical protein